LGFLKAASSSAALASIFDTEKQIIFVNQVCEGTSDGAGYGVGIFEGVRRKEKTEGRAQVVDLESPAI
jgi:hypothetical protein